jgi:hypothetical protein
MATLTRLCVLTLAACGDLEGYGGPTAPLVSFAIDVTGDFEAVRTDPEPVRLRLALVWGEQRLPEALCFTAAETTEVAAVAAAGCRDPLGFAPARVAANTELVLGTAAHLDLFALPAADVMVGSVTARIAYGSMVVYDDRDLDGTLRLRTPRPLAAETDGPDQETIADSPDRIYGASFVTMQEPDQRVAFREGAYGPASAFYPRAGCGEPPRGFSVLSAGGFSIDEALQAQLEGRLPTIDAATCAQQLPREATMAIALRPPPDVVEVSCSVAATDGSVRYRDPARVGSNELAGRTIACAHVPGSDGKPSEVVEAIVSSSPGDACKGISHFLLRGCRNGPGCPDSSGPNDMWDRTASPPEWWPCG